MHPSAELYIPVSDVHPSLAMQITLFSLLRGIKNFEKPKKPKKQNDRTHVSVSKNLEKPKKQKNQNDRTHVSVSKNLEKPKKPKKPKWQNLCPSIWHGASTFVFLFFWFFEAKPKKTKKPKWQNLCPSIWHGASTFVFFGFFGFSRQNQKKQKNQNGRTYVPVSGMGPVLLVFLFFWFVEAKPKKTKKNKKTKMAEPMSQYLAWGQYFCFFCFFWFFEAKPKKSKKPKWQNLCPSIWHGASTFVFFVFLVFRGKTKKHSLFLIRLSSPLVAVPFPDKTFSLNRTFFS